MSRGAPQHLQQIHQQQQIAIWDRFIPINIVPYKGALFESLLTSHNPKGVTTLIWSDSITPLHNFGLRHQVRKPLFQTSLFPYELRPNVDTLSSLVPTSIDWFIFCTLLGATKITQYRTPAQFLGNPQLSWKSPAFCTGKLGKSPTFLEILNFPANTNTIAWKSPTFP